MKKVVHVLFIILFIAPLLRAQPKALFYMTESPLSITSFLDHADKIDIIVPTWYHVDKEGMMWGGPDPLVLNTAKEDHVEVMPIVGLMDPSPKNFHEFLTNPNSVHEFIDALSRVCRINGYSGIQFDFENIDWSDSAAFGNLVSQAAAALHKNGYKLSIATIPNAPGYPGQTGFDYWLYSKWQGVYNLSRLAHSADMVCLMTYSQHTGYTPPGPVAGYPWTVENLDYALKFVPKDKLMLGIPTYGYHWFAGMPKDGEHGPNVVGQSISSQYAEQLAKSYEAKIQWDPFDKTSWFYFYRDNMREWVFYTNTRTFEARYDLVKKRGLEGFCSWVLGSEDPAIWTVLPSHH